MNSFSSMNVLAAAHQPRWTRRVHEDAAVLKAVHPTAQPTPSIRARPTLEIPPEALQFAPPLAAYTAEHCDADDVFLAYNSAAQSAVLRGIRDVALFLPHTLKKLLALQRIRETGYFTLRPVGVARTMADMDRDAAAEDEHRSPHAENLASSEQLTLFMQGSSVAEDVSRIGAGGGVVAVGGLGEAGGVNGVAGAGGVNSAVDTLDVPLLALASGMDRDLDAGMMDADVHDLSLRSDNRDLDTPDAFMAEDVEYQNDHSLASSAVGSVSSNAYNHSSAGSGPAWNNLLVTTSSRVLSTSSHRIVDELDVDMTLEE